MQTNRAGQSTQLIKRAPAVLAAAVLLAACGSSGSPSSKTTTLAPTTTSATVVADDVAILDAYRQSWADLIAASDPPNPDAPQLANHTTGKALQTLKVSLLNDRVASHASRGTIDLAPKLTLHSGDQAVVTDCNFDHSVSYDTKTDKALEQADTERQSWVATMQREGGAWKVSLLENKGRGCVVE